MSVAPAVAGNRSTIRAVPKPAPIRLGRQAVRALVEVESDLFDATAELVHQRDDLAEACSPENNALLERVLRIEGLPQLARELIRAALFIEAAEDAAARRAERRRAAAHDGNRAAIGGCERLLTGRAGPARCGRTHPLTDELAAIGVTLRPCHLAPHDHGACVFLSEGGPA